MTYATGQGRLTRETASALIARARALAADQELEVTIAVVDTAGFLIALERMDGAFFASIDAAQAKARAAALYQRDTSDFARRVNDGALLDRLPHVIPLGGGVVVRQNGCVIGALGVSGAVERTETALAESVIEEVLG